MTLLVNSRIRIAPDKITTVRRVLRGDGQILVSAGQEVSPSDVIGRSILSAGFRTINLAEALSVSPGESKKYLQRSLGKPIFKGELLAFKKGGLFGGKKLVIAPTDGILELFSEKTGTLKLKILPHQIDLAAAVFGKVLNVDHIKKEVMIKTQATQIYGVMGSGRLREGNLKFLGGRGDLIDQEKILPQFSDKILVGGGLIYTQALNKAVALGINGIISGGVNAEDYKSMAGGHLKENKPDSDVGIGILVTEGFGSIPIGLDLFDLLKGFEDKFVILEGNKRRLSLPAFSEDCLVKIRQTELVEEIDGAPVSTDELKLNKRVRVIGDPYLGEVGKLVSIDQGLTRLPSQIITLMVTIETASRKISVPYTNVEIIQ
ncbi:MAG: Uncharacterized protein CEO21_385 [Microgenomates group bacterium Gr01-1014_80]|nr:MAG: Uncharacterized protein CEO21_385 [Microgenomates group bacterium Gr01-1014_80]